MRMSVLTSESQKSCQLAPNPGCKRASSRVDPTERESRSLALLYWAEQYGVSIQKSGPDSVMMLS